MSRTHKHVSSIFSFHFSRKWGERGGEAAGKMKHCSDGSAIYG